MVNGWLGHECEVGLRGSEHRENTEKSRASGRAYNNQYSSKPKTKIYFSVRTEEMNWHAVGN